MMIAVPKSLLGLGDSIDIEFKWNDNMQYKGEILDFYVNGDTAPVARFNYHFVTDKAKSFGTEEDVILKTRASTRIEDMIVMAIDNPSTINNGEAMYIDINNNNVKPQIINGKTMVPIRFIGESLDADVSWNEETQVASINYNGNRVKIVVGSDIMQSTYKRNIKLESPALLLEDRVYVPVRDVAETLGLEVLWVDPGIIVVGEGASEVYNYSNVRSLIKENFIK